MFDANTANIIGQLGFPVFAALAISLACYKFLKEYMKESKEREAALIDANKAFSEALNKIAITLNETNEINKSLADTNDSLANTVETSLQVLNVGVERIIDKISDAYKLDKK